MTQPDVLQKPSVFFDRFYRKPGNQQTTHYCPGCGHGVLNKLMAEAIDDLGIQDQTLIVGPVGCGVFLYYYFDCSSVSAPHGRASAVATGISRSNPDGVTICYQGDGDLAAIGTNNAIHAANRGENMIVFFVNNNTYGMTGGQMAPTTLINQKTTTSPYGRSLKNDGAPLKMAEIMATLDAPVLIARVAVNSPKNVRAARRVIQRGLKAQQDKKGYVFIEVLSQCPTNWRQTPEESCRWIDEVVTECYPLGVLRDTIDEVGPMDRTFDQPDFQQLIDVMGLGNSREESKVDTRLSLPGPNSELLFKAAGFGGQGVLSLGLFLANAAMHKGFEVTWLPSYGPEMRGGVANCSVVIGKEPIGSPVVDCPNLLIAMNKPSMFKFGPMVPDDGTIIYNSSLIDELPDDLKVRPHAVRATDLAQQLGNVKVANTVMLSYMSRLTGLFTLDELDEHLQETFPNASLYELNLRAAKIGWDKANECESAS